jgi:gas vesicle protein
MGRNDSNGNTVLGLGIGLVAGAVLGVGIGLTLATKEGRAWRRNLRARARKLKNHTLNEYGRVDDIVGAWTTRGKEVAERLRTATAEGLREARRHAVAPRDPRGSDLAGVEGTAEGIAHE